MDTAHGHGPCQRPVDMGSKSWTFVRELKTFLYVQAYSLEAPTEYDRLKSVFYKQTYLLSHSVTDSLTYLMTRPTRRPLCHFVL